MMMTTELVNQPQYQFRAARKLLGSEVAISKMTSFITTIPDPDDMLRRAGIKRYQLRELELDDEVAQCKDTRVEAVIATPWRVEPNQNRVGKFITTAIENCVEDLIRCTLEARFYGYSVAEIIYEKVEKGIGVARLSQKPMEWFAPQQDGTLRYFPDDGSGGTEGIECDPLKFLLTRCSASYRNPYGESLLSRIYFPVVWRREGWGMWLQFLETFGEPIVLGQMSDYDSFVKAMEAQGIRSTIAWQSVSADDKVTTINASTPGEFERLEQSILRRIQKLILGQTLTSDVGSSGSYAAAAIHNEVRNDKRRSDLRMVMRTGQQLINNLCELNSFKDIPKFIMADDSGLELARSQRDAVLTPVLAASGLLLTKEYYLRNFDYFLDDLEEKEVVDPNEGMEPNEPSTQAHPEGDPTNQKKGGQVDSERDLTPSEPMLDRSVTSK
jgi:hypothetical protein